MKRLILALIALSFAFAISSCMDLGRSKRSPVAQNVEEKEVRHQRKW